jgi:hypothetical protein
VKVLLAFFFLLVVGTPVYYYVSATNTELSVAPTVKYVGYETPFVVHQVNPHGVRRLTVTVEQDGKSNVALDTEVPARRFRPVSGAAPIDTRVVIGRKPMPALHDGKIHVTITAVSNDFRARTASIGFDAEVFTAPHAFPPMACNITSIRAASRWSPSPRWCVDGGGRYGRRS